MQDKNALAPLDAEMFDIDTPPARRPRGGPVVHDDAPRRVPRALTNLEKAAVVVRLLLTQGADIPLESLPEELQARLTKQMGKMGLVDRVTLDAVAEEFAEALEGIGLSFPHGLAGALSALDGKITPTTAARLRREAGVRQMGDPWQRLRALPPAELAEIAEAESTEVAAVLLSKLDTAKAAALLGQLPGPVARRITYAISQTGMVTPEAVDRIGWSLAAQIDARPILAFADRPEKRVGNILNQSAQATREQVMTALDEEDAAFATSVRKVLFTFGDIPRRISPRDVPAIIRVADQDQLVLALAAATQGEEAAVAEFLLANMSARMADNLRDEIRERGKIKRSEGEAAMTALVAGIRTLEEDGALTLISPEDEEG